MMMCMSDAGGADRLGIRELADREACLEGTGCPDPGCPGMLDRDGEMVSCDRCGTVVDHPTDQIDFLG
jgi:hypothetical protein